MSKGLIYLIQPEELIGTKRIKLGCTKKADLDRCKNGYKKGSRYLCIMECENVLLLENKLKKIFSEKFKLIAGHEYFEGDIDSMHKEFIDVVTKHLNHKGNNNNDVDTSEDNGEMSDDENKNDNNIKIRNKFPEFQDDEIFGGKKKLIKITIANGLLYFSHIVCENGTIREEDYLLIEYSTAIDTFHGTLFKQHLIEEGQMYDINDLYYLKRIFNEKTKIEIDSDDLETKQNIDLEDFSKKYSTKEKITLLYGTNTIINNKYFVLFKDDHFIIFEQFLPRKLQIRDHIEFDDNLIYFKVEKNKEKLNDEIDNYLIVSKKKYSCNDE